MLERFLSEYQALEIPKQEELLNVSCGVVIKMCDLLANRSFFPANEIMVPALLFKGYIESGKIKPVINEKAPSLIFSLALEEDPSKAFPALIFPPDYIEQAKHDPIFQLGIVAYNASFAADFLNRAVFDPLSQMEAIYRARAVEVEVLLTIERIGEPEGIEVQWNENQMLFRQQFSQGLRSLPDQIASLRRQANAPLN